MATISSSAVAFSPNESYGNLFCRETFEYIRQQVMQQTYRLLKVPYSVPHERIAEVMETVWLNFRPNTGDIHTRYNINNDPILGIPWGNSINGIKYINYSADIIKQTVTIIVTDIVTTQDIKENNQRYSVWDTLSGINRYGMVHHPSIKLNERRPALTFNMNF